MRSGSRAIVSIALMLAATTACLASALPNGEKSIYLIAADQQKLKIGTVLFQAAGEASSFEVKLDAPQFSIEFLSMRPFSCLRDEKEMWCHLPYPYDMKGRVTAGDLTDLEYSLLFLFKRPQEFGIDAFKGLYFKLTASPAGINGVLHEADLSVLASPPPEGVDRPIEHLTPSSGSFEHRFTALEIR